MRRLIQRWKGGREWRGGRQHHFPVKYQTRTPRPSSSDLSVMSKASARCNNNIGLLLAWKNIWWTTVLDHNDPSYFMERYVSHSPIRIHWTSWNFLSWKNDKTRMTILVNIRIAVFSRPQLGNLESVFELFKLTFHSQAPLNQEPWFTQFWEALFKGLEFIWSSFWSLSEQSSLSFLLKLELLPMERKRMGRKVFPVNFPGIPTYPLDMDLPNIPQKSPIPIQWPLTDLPWSPTDFPWTPITSHWLANKARCLKLIESFLLTFLLDFLHDTENPSKSKTWSYDCMGMYSTQDWRGLTNSTGFYTRVPRKGNWRDSTVNFPIKRYC